MLFNCLDASKMCSPDVWYRRAGSCGRRSIGRIDKVDVVYLIHNIKNNRNNRNNITRQGTRVG
jgi:hypothetical protein